MTWNDYAVEYKQAFCKLIESAMQATRYEPSQPVMQWLVFLPQPNFSVYCKDIEQCRTLAAEYGCSIIL